MTYNVGTPDKSMGTRNFPVQVQGGMGVTVPVRVDSAPAYRIAIKDCLDMLLHHVIKLGLYRCKINLIKSNEIYLFGPLDVIFAT